MAGLRWSEAETAHLHAFYPAIGAKQLRELLPNRTPRAIRDKAIGLGILKTHERLREQGKENVLRRWYPPPIQA